MGSRPMPVCAPQVVANPAYLAMWSAMIAEVTLSISIPPYSSGTSTALRPSSPAFFSRSRLTEKSLCSILSMLGTISLLAKSSAVWPISWCCSLKSSGVKISSGLRSSNRKLAPATLVCGTADVLAMEHPLKPETTGGTRTISVPSGSVHETLDAVFQMDNVEVYKQSDVFTTELEVRKYLRAVDG